MIRVYTASKLKHAALWRRLCDCNAGIYLHARWLKHNKIGTLDSPENASEFWLQDEQDVKDADAVLVYAEGSDHLRGALVEAGMALAFGVPVFVVGDHEDYGTWRYHPGVRIVKNFDYAIAALAEITPRYRKRVAF
jgi:nucleoside 2-deoxyribosyltransferase